MGEVSIGWDVPFRLVSRMRMVRQLDDLRWIGMGTCRFAVVDVDRRSGWFGGIRLRVDCWKPLRGPTRSWGIACFGEVIPDWTSIMV